MLVRTGSRASRESCAKEPRDGARDGKRLISSQRRQNTDGCKVIGGKHKGIRAVGGGTGETGEQR